MQSTFTTSPEVTSPSPTREEFPFNRERSPESDHSEGSSIVTLTHSGPWRARERKYISNPQHGDPRRGRTLVLCFDGTGDQFDHDNSNIVQLVSCLKKDDPTKQLVYYQQGIGTYTSADMALSGLRHTSRSLDLMLATTLGHHVRDGYEFLSQNYTDGDVICIFGFSRGAYTARALAGMLQKIGLLPAWNKQSLPFAYHMYANEHEAEFCAEYKRTFCTDVKVEFVGVWDTVASVGLLPRHLPFIRTNNSIHYFRHAVALDERRAKFVPSFYHKEVEEHDDEEAEESPEGVREATKTMLDHVGELVKAGKLDKESLTFAKEVADHAAVLEKQGKLKRRPTREKTTEAFELEHLLNTTEHDCETNALEVWFAGVHTDVGGGSVANETRHSLARIPLRWMIREAWKAETGLMFDMQKLRDELGLGVDMERREIREAPKPLEIEGFKHLKSRRIIPDDENYIQKGYKQYIAPVVNAVCSVGSWIKSACGYPTKTTDIVDVGVADRDFLLEDVIQKLRTDPSSLGKYNHLRSSYKGEALEQLLDSLSPMYDQLHFSPSWWVLEWIPLWCKKEKAIIAQIDSWWDGHEFRINNGKGRKVYKHVVKRGIHVHNSVRTRLLALDHLGRSGTYVPRIRPNIKGRKKGPNGDPLPMTWEEWVTGRVAETGEPWLTWVD